MDLMLNNKMCDCLLNLSIFECFNFKEKLFLNIVISLIIRLITGLNDKDLHMNSLHLKKA